MCVWRDTNRTSGETPRVMIAHAVDRHGVSEGGSVMEIRDEGRIDKKVPSWTASDVVQRWVNVVCCPEG